MLPSSNLPISHEQDTGRCRPLVSLMRRRESLLPGAGKVPVRIGDPGSPCMWGYSGLETSVISQLLQRYPRRFPHVKMSYTSLQNKCASFAVNMCGPQPFQLACFCEQYRQLSFLTYQLYSVFQTPSIALPIHDE